MSGPEGVGVRHPRCPFCHDGVAPREAKAACDACMSWHHAECWSEHGACSACASTIRVGQRTRPRAGVPAGGAGLCPGCGAPVAQAPVGIMCPTEDCRWRFIDEERLAEALEAISEVQAQVLWDETPSGLGLERSPPASCPRCRQRLELWRLPGVLGLRLCPGHGVWVTPAHLALLAAARTRDASGFLGFSSELAP